MSLNGLPTSMTKRICCIEKQQKIMEKQIEELMGQVGIQPMTINSFTASPSVSEVGSTVTSVTFNWTLNKAPATQTISPTVGSVPPGTTSVIQPVSLTTTTNYTLTVNDGLGLAESVATANASVSFRHKNYWGTSPATSLSSGGILGLASSAFSTGRARTFTVDGGGQYIYYAYPNSYDSGGDALFTVNGFPTSGWVKTVVSFTNASGNTTSFSVYRSAAVQSGSGITITVT